MHDLLKKHWGSNSFRPLQEQIITAILEKQDLLACLPTGSGKSLCFQLPALCKKGLTLVVTPLIALMKDQVAQLLDRGIQAEAIFSGMSNAELERKLDNCLYGNIKLLYVSPERLQTDLFKMRAPNLNISTLVIDEAHCISQWGYDFRPSYLEIACFKETIPAVNTVAFTATATRDVKKDIQNQLKMKEPLFFGQSFHRANLIYWVGQTDNKEAQLLRALGRIAGSAIIYVHTRKKTQTLAAWLHKHGITAGFYHAGLSMTDRSMQQVAWTQGKVRVMVATAAFGMGIDKSDVNLVIHLDLPTSLEAYCQEAGRAGRSNNKAYAILWYDLQDIALLKQRWQESYPTILQVKKVYQHLVNYYKIAVGSHAFITYDFDLEDFKTKTGLYTKEAYYGLKVLEAEGFIQLNEAYYQPSKLYFLVSRQALYNFQLAHPSYDLLLKGLLRCYGGALFSPYCTIVEKKVGQLLNLMEHKIIQQLNALNRLKVIEYLPQKEHPQITFLTPRYLADALPLRVEKIEQKNKTAYAQLESVIHYITNKRCCRLETLLDYFEEDALHCGSCDVCKQQQRESQIDIKAIDEGRHYIIQAITCGQKELISVLNNTLPDQEKLLLEIIRMMLDAGEIHYQSPGKLQLGPSPPPAHL